MSLTLVQFMNLHTPHLMPALSNLRYERFAQEMVRGAGAKEAYGLAGYRAKRGVPCRLSAKPEVRRRIEELREEAGQSAVMDAQKMIQYLEKVLLTPAGTLHEEHPLCEAYVRTERAGTTTVRIKMPSKMEAAEKLIRMRGWYAPEKVEMEQRDTLGELLLRIRSKRD